MKLVTLPIKRILVSADNPRTVHEKEPGFIELAANVRAIGVQQPIQVRVHPKRKGRYELLAGARRLRAAQLANRVTVPALDYGKMPDNEAFKITFIENAHRQDLTPLEQGRAAAIALAKCKGDARAAAALLGRSERWVHLRAAIDAKLIPEWVRWVSEPIRARTGARTRYTQWTAAHLALIARFPSEVQKALLKDCQKSFDGWDEWTVKDLEHRTTAELMLLAKAPFDTGKDSKCAKCPHRSSVQPMLWAEKPAAVLKAKDRCLDRKCWERREVAACKKKVKELKAKHGEELLCVSNAAGLLVDRKHVRRRYGPYLDQFEFESCKKADKGAKPALVIAGSGKGKVRYVKVKEHAIKSSPHKPSAGERAKEREAERWNAVASRLTELLAKLTYADVHKAAPVCLLAILYGVEPIYGKEREKFIAQYEKVAAQGPAAMLDWLLETLWHGLVGTLDYTGPWDQEPKELEVLANSFGIDLQGLYAEIVAEEESQKQSQPESKGQDASSPEAAA